MTNFIQQIKANLQKPLPGRKAQNEMAHAVRKQPILVPKDARKAGVLALLYPKVGEWHIILIERESSNPNDRHGGQISFPGGTKEASDSSLAFTALRETHEEVGVHPDGVTVLGPVTPLYIPVSNFEVFPFLAYMTETPVFKPQETEVRSILEIPIKHFLKPETIQQTNLQISKNMTLQNVVYYDVKGHILWGATAMMLSEILEIIPRL